MVKESSATELWILCGAGGSMSGTELLASRLAHLYSPATVLAADDDNKFALSEEDFWRAPLSTHLAYLQNLENENYFLLVLGLPNDLDDAQRLVDLIVACGPRAALLWERVGYPIPRVADDLSDVRKISNLLTLSMVHRNDIETVSPDARVMQISAAIPDELFWGGSLAALSLDFAMFIGRTNPAKGAQHLIDAWQTWAFNEIQIPLRVFLVDPENSDLLDFDPSFVSIHSIHDPLERGALMRNAKWVIFPAQYDHLPQALLEAMAAGAYCVTTKINGHAIVADGYNGACISQDLSNLGEVVASGRYSSDEVLAIRRNAIVSCASRHSEEAARIVLSELMRGMNG